VDVVGFLAVAWTVIYLLVRYAGTLLADRRAARIASGAAAGIASPPAAAPNAELVPHHRPTTVIFTIATVGFAFFAAWLMRRRTPSAS
jgi:hypothetical protein